jgi:large subunit ribosomal protein L14
MVSKETLLKSSDNCGALYIKCINLGSGYRKRRVGLGDYAKFVVRSLKSLKKRIARKQKYTGLVIRTARKIVRRSGISIKGFSNGVLLLNDKLKFLGTNVYGPICREIRSTKRLKTRNKQIISYSGGYI